MEVLQSDVTVIGGGLAGVCAAISAAEEGSNVIFIGDRPVLGGNSSSEIRVWTRGATGAGNLYAEEMGTLGCLKMRNLYSNLDGNVVLWDEVLLEAILEHKNITLLLNTHITEAETGEEGEITSIRGFQLLTEKQFLICSKIYIDATGDGTVGYLSGAVMKIGEEEYKKGLNNEKAQRPSKGVQGNTVFYYTEKTDKPVRFIPPSYVYDMDYIKNLIGNGGRVVNEQMSGSDFWWFEYGGLRDTIADAQDITLELKKIALGVWNYIKNSGNYDSDCLTLKWIGNVPGKRESRRVKGVYELTEEDILAETCFPDGVCYGGWYMDSHPASGIFSKEANCKQVPVFPYQIPLRCLYGKEIKNLLFAGRDIGVSSEVFVSSRVMNTCALTGQSAGITAAICARYSTFPAILGNDMIQEIQIHLLRKDMFIPGLKRADKADLAKRARAFTSSSASAMAIRMDHMESITEDTFVTAAIPPKVDTLYLLMQTDENSEVTVQMSCSLLPSRLIDGKLLGMQSAAVVAGKEPTWVSIKIPEAGRGRFVTLRFENNPLVRIASYTGKKTGFLMGHKNSSNYLTPCFRLQGEEQLYDAGNLIENDQRPYGQPNVWAADEQDLAPTVELQWEEEVKIHQINLYLNPDLSMEIPSSRAEKWDKHHYFTKREGMPLQLVKAFDVYVCMGDEWKLIASEEENWKRLCELKIPQLSTKALRIVIRETYGAPAEIFRIIIL